MPTSLSQLKSQVDSLWNRFLSGGISNPLTAIVQMSYLIFLKWLEGMDNACDANLKLTKSIENYASSSK